MPASRSIHAAVVSTALLTGLTSLGGRASDAAPSRPVPGLGVRTTQWQLAPASSKIRSVPIKNFGVVSPGCLYRSAQPTSEGFAWLAKHGFRSVVSLRKEHDNGAERMKALGLKYLYLPVPDYHAPTDEQGRTFLQFVRNPDNWPVLVHCEAGIGRAGTMAALARYAIDGWSMSDALREARNYRPLKFRVFGEQRRWLNRWKDRFEPASYRPEQTASRVETQ
jgi:atypical dual specificity phosphatase